MKLLSLAALAVLAASALAIGSGAFAQSPSGVTLTLKELEKGSTFTHVRNTKAKGPRSIAQGDVLAFTNPMADAAGHVVGKLYVDCVATVAAHNFLKSVLTCSGVVTVREGSLTVQVNSRPGASAVTGAVTGGTGAYANARGVLVSKQTKTGSIDTITLAD